MATLGGQVIALPVWFVVYSAFMVAREGIPRFGRSEMRVANPRYKQR
ncbi:hypothetical protein [Promineifilum sp.]